MSAGSDYNAGIQQVESVLMNEISGLWLQLNFVDL